MTEIISDWTESTERPGYKIKVIKHGEATVRIFRPILDEAERKKREDHLKRVAEAALRDYYKRKAMKEYEQQNHN